MVDEITPSGLPDLGIVETKTTSFWWTSTRILGAKTC